MKIIQNCTGKSRSGSESEEGEIEDQDGSDLELKKTGIPEKDGYKPIHTSSDDELNLHTDAEIPTGESKNEDLIIPYTERFWRLKKRLFQDLTKLV